jgi:Flp pilus assembly pilin Flp
MREVTQASEMQKNRSGSPCIVWRTVSTRRRIPMNYLKSFVNDERGAELAEYAVGTAILVAIAIIVYRLLGDAINVKMSAVANEVQK